METGAETDIPEHADTDSRAIKKEKKKRRIDPDAENSAEADIPGHADTDSLTMKKVKKKKRRIHLDAENIAETDVPGHADTASRAIQKEKKKRRLDPDAENGAAIDMSGHTDTDSRAIQKEKKKRRIDPDAENGAAIDMSGHTDTDSIAIKKVKKKRIDSDTENVAEIAISAHADADSRMLKKEKRKRQTDPDAVNAAEGPLVDSSGRESREPALSKDEKKRWREQKLLRRLDRQRQLREAATAAGGRAPAAAAPPLPFPAAAQAGRPVPYTLALAVPGSILENAQSAELRALLAGQVARAAAIYCVDEVVVFNDQGAAALQRTGAQPPQPAASCQQLACILQYLECPQYLRRQLFPMSGQLRHAGLLAPLDCPHHLRRSETSAFREGVVTTQPPAHGGRFSMVNIGLQREVRCDRLLTPGVRVTLRLDGDGRRGQVVPPRTPRLETGTYWGYQVRQALSLADVFTQSPHAGGYDLLIGTSDKGTAVADATAAGLPAFRHALVVLGGVQGLEAALENDDRLTVPTPAQLFDLYVNVCPGQGCRTIRSEEALLITMAALQPALDAAGRRAGRDDHEQTTPAVRGPRGRGGGAPE